MSNYVPLSFDGLLAGDYDLLELRDTGSRLTITLHSGDLVPSVTVSFDEALLYRVADEGDLLKTVEDISRAANRSLVYQVEQSGLLEWLDDQSYGTRSGHKIMHFCIAGTNSIIDVAAFRPPAVSHMP